MREGQIGVAFSNDINTYHPRGEAINVRKQKGGERLSSISQLKILFWKQGNSFPWKKSSLSLLFSLFEFKAFFTKGKKKKQKGGNLNLSLFLPSPSLVRKRVEEDDGM